MHQQAPAPFPPQVPTQKKSSKLLGCAVITLIGAVLIFILVAASGGGSDSPSSSSASGSPKKGPDSPAVQPQTYRGRGAKVVRIKDGGRAWLVSLVHKGTSNFSVEILDAKGKTVDLLVNTT